LAAVCHPVGSGDTLPAVNPAEETARIAAALREAIERHGASFTELSRERLGRAPDYLSKMLRGERTFRIDDLLLILAAIEVAPDRFFAELYDLYRAEEIGTVFGEGMFEGKLRRMVDGAVRRATRELAAGKKRRRRSRPAAEAGGKAKAKRQARRPKRPKATGSDEAKNDGKD